MNSNVRRPIPIGQSDYKTIIEKNMFYIDKTIFIKEILEANGLVKLITRPRRFGKTLNMSMLQYFFEKTEISNRALFEGKAIESYPKLMAEQGKWPVIFLSLRNIKASHWSDAYEGIQRVVSDEFMRHDFLLELDCILRKY